MTTNAGEDTETLYHSCIAGRNVWYSRSGKQISRF